MSQGSQRGSRHSSSKSPRRNGSNSSFLYLKTPNIADTALHRRSQEPRAAEARTLREKRNLAGNKKAALTGREGGGQTTSKFPAFDSTVQRKKTSLVIPQFSGISKPLCCSARIAGKEQILRAAVVTLSSTVESSHQGPTKLTQAPTPLSFINPERCRCCNHLDSRGHVDSRFEGRSALNDKASLLLLFRLSDLQKKYKFCRLLKVMVIRFAQTLLRDRIDFYNSVNPLESEPTKVDFSEILLEISPTIFDSESESSGFIFYTKEEVCCLPSPKSNRLLN